MEWVSQVAPASSSAGVEVDNLDATVAEGRRGARSSGTMSMFFACFDEEEATVDPVAAAEFDEPPPPPPPGALTLHDALSEGEPDAALALPPPPSRTQRRATPLHLSNGDPLGSPVARPNNVRCARGVGLVCRGAVAAAIRAA